MTVKEYINNCLDKDMDALSLESIVAIAYYMGREDASKTLIGMFYDKIEKMRERASKCPYPHLANAVIGTKKENFIYSKDYAKSITNKYSNLELDYMEEDF